MVLRFSTIFAIFSALVFVEARAFDFSDVEAFARKLGAKNYEEPGPIPSRLQALDYDGYRKIKNASGQALFEAEELPFRVELLHLGYLFKRPVEMNVISADAKEVVPISFDPTDFDYSRLDWGEAVTADDVSGYAGFRVRHPLNDGGEFDEILSALGASYF